MTAEDPQPPSGHDPTLKPRDQESTDDRTLVQITQNVGLVYGVDGREYELLEGNVVTLPSITADPLLEKDAAATIDQPGDASRSRPPPVAEAEAVAGDEPTRREDPGPELPAAIEGELQRRRESRDDQTGDEDGLGAAAFMDPDSAHASNDTPEPEPSTSGGVSYERTVSALPLAQLDALTPDERRRAARKRGLEWPIDQ